MRYCLTTPTPLGYLTGGREGGKYLDIREFYGDESDLKPGKKGISLNQEQVRATAARLHVR